MENGWIIPVHRKNCVLTVFIFVYYTFCMLVPTLQSTEVFHMLIFLDILYKYMQYHKLVSLGISYVGVPGYIIC